MRASSTYVSSHLNQHKENDYFSDIAEIVEYRQRKNRRVWRSRLLSAITIGLVLVVTAGPASAQFTPPSAPTTIPCVGFFCNVADKVTTNGMFSPMASVINGFFTMVNLAVGGLYIVRGYGVVRMINRNQEEWKQDALNIGISLAVIFIVYIISLAFLS